MPHGRRPALSVALSLLLVTTAAAPPVARAEDPAPNDSQPASPNSRPDATAVDAAPIVVAGGGGPGSSADGEVLADGTSISPSSPAYKPPKAATEVVSLRQENARVIANPDGTFSFEKSSGRLNYRDAQGVFQAIDLSLEVDPTTHDLTVKGLDREVTIGIGDDPFLAAMSSESGTVQVTAVGFGGGTLADDGKTVVYPNDKVVVEPTPEPSGNPVTPPPSPSTTPAPTQEPSSAPVTTPSPSPAPTPAPDPSASPPASSPSSELPAAAPSSEVLPSASPTPPSASSTPSAPAPEASLEPAAPPPAEPSASPAASDAPIGSAAPTDAPPVVLPPIAEDPSHAHVVAHGSDQGFEFGATLLDRAGTRVFHFVLTVDAGVTVELAADGRTIHFLQSTFENGTMASVSIGGVSAPVVADVDAVGPSEAVDVAVLHGWDKSNDPSLPQSLLDGLGPNEVVLTYRIDDAWLDDPARVYPVTMDPTVCIQHGSTSGCDVSANYFDHYAGSGQANTYPTSPSILRVGYDDIGSPDAAWGQLRTYMYFDQLTLADGAQVTDAALVLRQDINRDGANRNFRARPIKIGWGDTSTWNELNDKVYTGLDSPDVASCDTGATNCDLVFDVSKAVRAWYTRRGADWKADVGFEIKMSTESTAYAETDFYTGDSSSPGGRPELQITYVVPKVKMDFAPELGPNYAPSAMVAGLATKLPLTVLNDGSGFAYDPCVNGADSDCYQLGYRFFDSKGTVATVGQQDLATAIASGSTVPITLAVTPPATPGSYTLRLDLVHRVGGSAGTFLWASDWALPGKYYARSKKLLSPDNTRWTGASVIEREEFGIEVSNGAKEVNRQTVGTGDGGSLGIDLATRNLHYEGAGGVGFADLVPMGLSYGYDSKNAASCTGYQGILDACGWYTNYDERLTDVSPSGNPGDFVYQGSSGTRYFLGTDGQGQITGSAPVLIERPRVTFVDENGLTANSLVNAATAGVSPAPSGASVARFSTTTGILGLSSYHPKVDINTYRSMSFSIRTSGASGAALAFKIHNATGDPADYPDTWLAYTVGTSWTTPYSKQINLGGASVANVWRTISARSIYDDVRTQNLGKTTDRFEIIGLAILSNSTTTTYLDAFRFEPTASTSYAEAKPTYSSFDSLASDYTGDAATGTKSLKVISAALGGSPTCNTTTACWSTTWGELWAQPFASWNWKKIGGDSIAIRFDLKDMRANSGGTGIFKTGAITYYTGPTAPAGSIDVPTNKVAVQVAETAPTEWTKVTRNLLEDARQLLYFYNDSPYGSSSSAPPTQGPTGDEVRWTGYTVSGVDGSFALFDDLAHSSLPDVSPAGSDDFRVTYADRSIHTFGRDGLLHQIIDRDANAVTLDWTYDAGPANSQANYTLAKIRAATDATVAGSWTYDREIGVTTTLGTGGAPSAVTFAESLGSTGAGGSPPTGRSTVFKVATATGTGLGIGDVLSIKPARRATACAGSGASGCALFAYTDTTNHRLAFVADPRWDQLTSGSNGYRFGVTWTANDPTVITDQSHAAAPILRVVSWDRGTSSVSVRPLWQDAAAIAAGFARHLDLMSDGRTIVEYVPQACTAGDCVTNPPNGSDSTLGTLERLANAFDGLSRVNQTTQYRTAGGNPVVTRQASRAGSKVDNYVNPLVASQLAWSQTADQYFASLAASSGADPDLYRTAYAYNDHGEATHVIRPAANDRLTGGTVAVDTEIIYDRLGHPLQIADTFATNPGFESGTAGWTTVGTVSFHAKTSPSDPDVHAGNGSLTMAGSSSISQDLSLVPGQTVRVQGWAKVASGGTALYTFEKYQAGAWSAVSVTGNGPFADSSWTSHAWDVTVPVGSDGRLRVRIANSAGGGTVYLDDATAYTSWSSTSYWPNGLPAATTTLSPIGPTKTTQSYSSRPAHPAIFVTASIANDIAIIVDPTTDDVTSTTTYDAWGRPLVATDPDFVAATTHYRASGDGAMTDVDWVADGLGQPTTMTYDIVGNRETSTAPRGERTSTTYDLFNHAVTTTTPDWVVSRNDYDVAGQLVKTTANYVNGVPSAGLDDVVTVQTLDEYGRAKQTDVDDGQIDARTTVTYDLLGNTVTSTVSTGPNGTGSARTTTNYFEVGHGLSRSVPTATKLPIAPTAALPPDNDPPPSCPNGSGYCNVLTELDLDGRAVASTDAYGHTTRSLLDLAGRPVSTTTNYVDGLNNGSELTTDLITTTAYTMTGQVSAVTDVAGYTTTAIFDALGRQTRTSDPAQVFTRTTYTAGGRVERTSRPAAPNTADVNLVWTKSIYDAAGRQTRTLDHYDITGAAHLVVDGFERDFAGWSATASGYFTINAAAGGPWAGTTDSATGPKTGLGRLQVTTSASASNSGVYRDLSGQTFTAGRTYRLRFDFIGWSGVTYRAFLGQDAAGTNYREVDADPGTSGTQPIIGTGGWQTFDVSWTPTATVSSNVHFAVRKDAAGSASIYLDNIVLFDTATPDWNIPSDTVYDADGRPVVSVLPPGDPASERPMVTATAYDAMGRAVGVSVNAQGGFQNVVNSDIANSVGVGWWGLDELSSTDGATDLDATNDLTVNGGVVRGVAGATDEARTAYRFNGTDTYLSTPAVPTLNTNNFSIEAWFRYDTLPSGDVVIAMNGRDSGGFGVTLHGGHLAGLFGSVAWLDSGITPKAGPWHHAALVRNAGTTTLYLDGAPVGPTFASTPLVGSGNFSIGAQFNAAGSVQRYFPGDIDEVAVYATALSSARISAHWTAGRIVSTDSTTALTTTTSYDALGHATAATDPRGIITRHVYDRLGRPGGTFDNYVDGFPTDGSAVDDDLASIFAYDALGELTGYCSAAQVLASFPTTCDPSDPADARSWHYTYDAMGRQTTQVPPVNVTATGLDTSVQTYDPGGRLLSVTDQTAGGTIDRHVDYAYDAVGRVLTDKVYAGAGTGSLKQTTTRTWTINSSPATVALAATADGYASDPPTITFTYDQYGRPDLTKSGATTMTEIDFAPDGTVSQRKDTLPTVGTVTTSTFTYDWAGRQASVAATSIYSGSSTYAYRLDGLLAKRTLPSAETLTYGFDAVKRPTSLALTGGRSFGQAYDRTGNVTSESRTLDAGITGINGSGTATYSYDPLGRLIGETGLGANRAYGYDLDGNRTTTTEAGVTRTTRFDRTDQPIDQSQASVWTTAFSSNNYGDLLTAPTVTGGTSTYAYDTAGRTKTIATGGNTATLLPDALGRVRSRSVAGVTDIYGYIGGSETVVAIDGGTDRLSVTAPDGSRVATKDGTTTGFVLADLHGNVAGALSSTTSAIVNAIRYDAYGKTMAAQYTGTGSVSLDQRYQGRLDLAPAGGDALYEFSARDYAPNLGTFTSLDSVLGSAAAPRSLNRFLYALANPATLIDPTGHRPCEYDCEESAPTPTETKHSHQVAVETAENKKSKRSDTKDDDSTAGGAAPPSWTPSPGEGANDETVAWPIGQPGTVQLMAGPCGSASAAFGLALGIQVCVLFDVDDPGGDAGIVITPSLQGSTAYDQTGIQSGSFGVVGAATAGLMLTNSRSPADMSGWFVNVGGSLGDGIAYSGDVSIGQADDGYVVGAVDFGIGPGAGVEVHGGPTKSIVIPFDPNNLPVNPRDIPVPFGPNPFVMWDLFLRSRSDQ